VVCKTTSTRHAPRRRTAGALRAQARIAGAITALLVPGICACSPNSSQSFAALINCVGLDDANRLAIDQIPFGEQGK